MAYSTAAEVKNQAVSQIITDAGWTDPDDIDTRIADADRLINAKLAAMGYAAPFSTTPPLVNFLSKTYAKYLILLDAYTRNSNEAGLKEETEKYKNEFDGVIKQLEDGDALLLDTDNDILERGNEQVKNAADDVEPIFTMDSPENLDTEPVPEYYDDDIKGV